MLYLDSGKQPTSTVTVSQSVPDTSVTPNPDATSRQLYERRFEEGYNLFDEGYHAWLKQNILNMLKNGVKQL